MTISQQSPHECPLVCTSHLNRWLYSTCGKCEICAVNPTSWPYQHNSGRVSFLEILTTDLEDGPRRTCIVNERMCRALFNASSLYLHRKVHSPLIYSVVEYMVSPAEHLTQFPAQLESTLVALLLCGTLVVYSLLAMIADLCISRSDCLLCVGKSQS